MALDKNTTYEQAYILGITSDFEKSSEKFWADDFTAISEFFANASVYSLRTKKFHKIKKTNLLPLPKSVPFYKLSFALFRTCLSLLQQQNIRAKDKVWSILALISFCYLYIKNRRPLPDVVFCFWSHYPSIVIPLFHHISKLMNVKISTVGFSGAYDIDGFESLSLYNFRFSQFCYTHCDANKAFFKKAHNFPVHRVYRGVDLDAFRSLSKPTFREKNKRIFAFIGRIDESKNIFGLLNWHKEIFKALPNVRLRIIGEGPDKDRLKKAAKEAGFTNKNLSIESWKTHEELVEILNDIDFLFQPSIASYERLPNIVKEALACGVIPIVGPSIGISELVKPQWGEIFDFTRPPSQDKLPNLLFADSHTLSLMAVEGQKHIETHFDRRKNIRSLIDWIRSGGLHKNTNDI